MSVEILKANLMQGRKIIGELAVLNREVAAAQNIKEKEFFDSGINSLLRQFNIINNSIPNLISGISAQEQVVSKKTTAVQIPAGTLILNKNDRRKFLQELMISEDALKKLRRERKARKTVVEEFKKPSAYVAIASRFFSEFSFKLADYDIFKYLDKNLKKANTPYLLSTYISIMLFSAFSVFVISFLLVLLFSFFNMSMVVGSAFPVFKFLGFGSAGLRFLKTVPLSLTASIITFLLFYIYPSSQATSISNKIRSEMPFAVIHMSSIAGR